MQSRGDGVKRGRNNQFPANIKTLSAQQTLIGSLLYLIKAAPTGVLRRNMFLNTHPDGNIIVTDEVKKIMKELNDIYQLAPTTETDGDVSELLDNIVTISE